MEVCLEEYKEALAESCAFLFSSLQLFLSLLLFCEALQYWAYRMRCKLWIDDRFVKDLLL